MKTTKYSFLRRTILLLAFVMLLTAFAANTVLAGNSDPTLTFTFDSDECTVTLIINDSADPIPLVSGEAVDIPYGAKVKVTVETAWGYELQDIIDANDAHSIMQPNTKTYQVDSFLSSVSAQVQCKTSVFKVVFEQGGDVPYVPVSGDMAELRDLQYHYMQSENLTQLPVVQRTGYKFVCWQIVKSDGSEVHTFPETQTYIPYEIINQDMVDTGNIYLHAEFTPIPQDVVRQDKVYDLANGVIGHLNTYTGQIPMDTLVSALTQMGDDQASEDPQNPYLNYKSYIGYELYVNYDYEKKMITIPPVGEDNPNTFYRYYTPIVYTIVYQNLLDGTLPEGAPQQYVYNETTHILNPERRGYTFMGWKIFVDGVQIGTQANPNFSFYKDDVNNTVYAAADKQIVFEAVWQANTYDITYQWGDGVSADLITNKAELPTSFTFDATCFIPNPYRPGYTFDGWKMTYTDNGNLADASGLTEGEGGHALNCSMYTAHVTLTAKWKPESYKVELNVDGTVFDTIETVVYDQALPVQSVTAPTLYGYNFVGYFSAPNGQGQMYFDANGNCAVAKWGLDGENNGTIVLYAFWERKPVSITVTPIEKVPEGIKIIIVDKENNKEYEGGTATLLFGTEYYVKIEMPEGFKIVEWNGVAIENYSGTTFQSNVARIETEDAIVLSAKARPDAPNVGVGEDVGNIIVDSDTSIKVPFANADVAGRYEVAISRDPNDTNLNWNQVPAGDTYYLFTGLNPGTTYYVFIRLQETDNTNSGIPTVKEELTRYDAYVNSVIEQLNGMFTQNDGSVTQALIQITVNKIEELKNSETLPDDFYAQIEALIAEAEQRIVFTRFQDSKIAALDTFYQSCINSKNFSKINEELLEALCLAAVADISSAENEAAVNEIYNIAKAAMDAVPVTYLYATDSNSSITLESLLGLQQGGGIALHSVEDIKALRRAIADAIAQGNITAGSFITIEEATDLLRVLDTVGVYQLYITNVQPTKGDEFVFTITIPEHLAGRTGLQVAYYNTATGMVELLETTVEGNTIVFRAKQVADFVILADPVINLTGVVIALGVIVLCLLIAVLLVLAARNKAKNTIQHASVALPILFAAQFLPANAELIALALGVIAIILQVVLMWLLISSGMIRISKAKKAAPVQQNAPAVAGAFEQAENASEESIADDFIEEGAEYGELADEDLGEYEATEEVYDEESYGEDTEEVYDEDGAEVYDEETEEVYDDEEFIESATDPYYSMNDEENVYEFDEEETQRVPHAEETDTETEGQADDTNTLDGVFGEGDVQDGYYRDEAGDSRYEDEYDDSYEAGDEAFAAQTNTEDADRAEEAGQGTVDTEAYIINDEEELSDAEEMYQYDE